MSFTPRTRYLLLTAAVLTASVIQLMRGYRPLIVLVGALVFIALGNIAIYFTGAKERAVRRQDKRDHWAG